MRLHPVIPIVICLAAAGLSALACPAPLPAADAAETEDSFAGHMKAAWQALGKRDVAQAKTEISAGKQQAAGVDEKNEAVRMSLLVTCLERFWKAVDDEWKRLATGDELKVDGTMSAVVEIDAKAMTLHIEGKNKKSTRAALPTAWARAIAEHRLDGSAPNLVLLGAFLTAEPQGDRDEARRLLEKAQKREPTAGEVLQLLASAYIPPPAKAGRKVTPETESDQPHVAGKVDVPEKGDLTSAQRKFKETYAADVKGAKTAEQRLELSQKLVEAAESADSLPLRYTLLREALNLAAGAADVGAIDKLLDALDEQFNIDLWAVSAEALTKAAPAAKGSAIGEVVHRALKLLAQVDQQEAAAKKAHAKAAQKLDQATLAAAQRAKDSDLVSEVVDRKKSGGDN